MLNSSDTNLSYFAATRLPYIFKLLEVSQEWEAMNKLVDKLVELRKSGRLEDETHEFVDHCIGKYRK